MRRNERCADKEFSMDLALTSQPTYTRVERARQVAAPTALAPARQRALALELDALKARTFAELGEQDVRYVRRLDRVSRGLEALGRVLIHVSVEPVAFTLGVLALWLHKQLQSTEIGHTALHGAYDKLPGAEAFASKSYVWDLPIDEESWRSGHNLRHHGNTNVAGKDPDIEFGPVRLTGQTAHGFRHYLQLPLTLGLLFPNFAFLMNLHFTGVLEPLYDKSRRAGSEPRAPRTRAERLAAYRRALRKYGPYYLKNYVLFPALAGPMFGKVLLGNWLAETLRDIYSAATIYCGHVGEDVRSYPLGTKARSRGEWYAMQIEAAHNFEVSRPISVLCGGLDLQIEHHLFPTLPPERLRQIAPEVRAICARHGVAYRSASWPKTLKKALAHVARLSKRDGAVALLSSME
jgi:linoleoyl-CoA desaturase